MTGNHIELIQSREAAMRAQLKIFMRVTSSQDVGICRKSLRTHIYTYNFTRRISKANSLMFKFSILRYLQLGLKVKLTEHQGLCAVIIYI